MEALESKDLKVNHGKIKVMVSGGIIEFGLSKSKVDACTIYSLSVRANTVLRAQYGKRIYDRCARMKWVIPKIS